MIDIYVCEDSLEEREIIVRYIKSIILIQEYDMTLKMSTDNPEKIIKMVNSTKNTGLYFLDIDLRSDKNGLVLAAEIRKYDPRGFIVFVTSHSEMSFLTFQYKVEALDFILKDGPKPLQTCICECIENVHEKYMNITRGEGKTITIKRNGRKITLEYKQIIFFETSVNEHKLVVHTENKSFEFFGKMKDIEAEVGDDFIRCHRAYLVNKKNIKEIDFIQKNIIMKNGTSCPISYRMLGKVRRHMNNSNSLHR